MISSVSYHAPLLPRKFTCTHIRLDQCERPLGTHSALNEDLNTRPAVKCVCHCAAATPRMNTQVVMWNTQVVMWNTQVVMWNTQIVMWNLFSHLNRRSQTVQTLCICKQELKGNYGHLMTYSLAHCRTCLFFNQHGQTFQRKNENLSIIDCCQDNCVAVGSE